MKITENGRKNGRNDLDRLTDKEYLAMLKETVVFHPNMKPEYDQLKKKIEKEQNDEN